MEYRTLGRTGVKVSTHCLGTMMFGPWGNTDEAECIRMIHTAIDAGINFVDTADVYGEGRSEEIVGKALQDRRDEVVLATKVHSPMGKGLNDQGNSRYWIMKEVENSLRRLQTDHIDLYQMHRPDPDTDIEETLGALSDLVHQGKVRYVGCSTFPGWEIVQAHAVSERRGLERFVSEQPPYSIFVRHIEWDVLPVAERYGMGVPRRAAGSPVGIGRGRVRRPIRVSFGTRSAGVPSLSATTRACRRTNASWTSSRTSSCSRRRQARRSRTWRSRSRSRTPL